MLEAVRGSEGTCSRFLVPGHWTHRRLVLATFFVDALLDALLNSEQQQPFFVLIAPHRLSRSREI